jgi:23S rRNA (adenine1618-N6)-methyltransferase
MQGVARSITVFPKHLLPFPSEYTFEVPDDTIDGVSQRLNDELASLPVQWTWRKNLGTGVGFAMENVWSRQARRKMRQAEQTIISVDESKAALGFKVQVKKTGALEEKGTTVIIRWLKGEDSVLFESFCGMVKRKVERR